MIGFTTSRFGIWDRPRKGSALVVLLAFFVLLVLTIVIGEYATHNYGALSGLVVGVVGCAASLVSFYYLSWRFDVLGLRNAREKYRFIYRVRIPPDDPTCIFKPEGAEIRIGDFGWEAWPIRKDGLIYLQGLTREWTVVWHAGFRPDQIELVGTKPKSQFDYWIPYWATPSTTPCPFPVEDRETLTMGLPHHSHGYFMRHTLHRPQGSEPTASRDAT